MKTLILTTIWVFVFSSLFPQENDTITKKKPITFNEVVITATRTKRKLEDIPAQVDVIDSKEIEDFPVNNIDDILKTTANVYVNRSWGIFSKNSSVTMRGLEGSARSLILVNGIPKNKVAGGSVNWHNINPDNIERIEIIKGPGSALYGNNSMGGVINIITKKPEKEIEGSAKIFYGSYNTFGASLNLMGTEVKNNKGIYWQDNGFYRQGDGYIYELPENIDGTDAKIHLREFGGKTLLGYQFNKSHNLDIAYDYYNELRGTGQQVYEEDGSYETILTEQVIANYQGKIRKSELTIALYYQQEDYERQNESLNDYNEYKLLDAQSVKIDEGLSLIFSSKFGKRHYVTIGGEIRSGNVTGDEIYRTSPDLIDYSGAMEVYGMFIQDEINLLKNKLKIIAGIRNDVVSFHNGYQSVTDPTKTTGFTESFQKNFKSNQWNALSPKIALQYNINTKSKLYASVSTGFKPPNLDDLCKTGKIRKGFRLANPDLQPETLTNYEIGYNRTILSKLKLNSAIYYSFGEDFQYLIGTGDSLDTGGSSLKPVLERKNVTKIEIIGCEISLNYRLNKNLIFNTNYAYNHSVIVEYARKDGSTAEDLTGNYIVEVSPHLFYAGLSWKNKMININLNCNYTDEQWADDENTVLIEDYFVVNLKLSKTIKKRYHLYIDVQNILDEEYVDRKGRLSPGRFIMGGFKFII